MQHSAAEQNGGALIEDVAQQFLGRGKALAEAAQ
jgi:hypothetical protein